MTPLGFWHWWPQINLQSVFPSNMTCCTAIILPGLHHFSTGSTLAVTNYLSSPMMGWGSVKAFPHRQIITPRKHAICGVGGHLTPLTNSRWLSRVEPCHLGVEWLKGCLRFGIIPLIVSSWHESLCWNAGLLRDTLLSASSIQHRWGEAQRNIQELCQINWSLIIIILISKLYIYIYIYVYIYRHINIYIYIYIGYILFNFFHRYFHQQRVVRTHWRSALFWSQDGRWCGSGEAGEAGSLD